MMSLTNGTASFQAGEQSRLCEANGRAATSSANADVWHVRRSNGNPNQYTLSYGGDPTKTLSLSEDSDSSDDIAIVTKPMEGSPHPTQLWTLEEAIGPLIFPPMMQGRLQSCARPDLSAIVSGSGVMAVPNERARDDRDNGLWHVRYHEVS